MKKAHLNVLIVEDNADHVILLKKKLEILNYDYTVSVYGSGEEARKYLEQLPADSANKPHLVFLDLGLPGEHGLDVLKQIRDLPNHRRTPIIVITASDQKEDIKQAYKRGGTLYLKKPWSEEDLKEAMIQLQVTNRLD